MQYFTIEAPSPREALERMRRDYGQGARILTHRAVRRGGLFGVFAREGVEITGYVPAGPRSGPAWRGEQGSSLEENRKKILAEAKREQSLQLILKEIQNLKENFQAGPKDAPRPAEGDKPAGLARIESLLLANEFSSAYVSEIVQRIRREFSLEDLENFGVLQSSVLEWIGRRIRIYQAPEVGDGAAKVFIIVGPTGVGKTTTIAKLAAIYGVGTSRFPSPQVKIVTIDNYRIAALRQIETYAEIMRIPVTCVESAAEFKKFLAMSEGTNLILVDTIGRSPRDLSKLAEMKDVLTAAGSHSEIHLAVSATTKASDVEEILKQFEPFRYNAVILTKLDETLRIGNMLSVLSALNKPISFIADGQSVPQDIEKASVVRLLMNLEGLQPNRERLEKLFGAREKISETDWS
ncbi:MAG: flagellar biosynthesis protein FlhF [Spirochaetales bacterium]|nr:flagellar biosynthesis protein FlhF [Spirochaetales bacterium]